MAVRARYATLGEVVKDYKLSRRRPRGSRDQGQLPSQPGLGIVPEPAQKPAGRFLKRTAIPNPGGGDLGATTRARRLRYSGFTPAERAASRPGIHRTAGGAPPSGCI